MMYFTCTCKKSSYTHTHEEEKSERRERRREEKTSTGRRKKTRPLFSHFLFYTHVCMFTLFCEIDIAVSAMTAHAQNGSVQKHTLRENLLHPLLSRSLSFLSLSFSFSLLHHNCHSLLPNENTGNINYFLSRNDFVYSKFSFLSALDEY